MSHTIESLMRKLEEKRREERIAALTEKASPDMWKVIPQPDACPRCREFAAHSHAEKPEPPHPNCKCRIEQKEKEQKEEVQKRYYVIGRRPLDKKNASISRLEKSNDKDIYKDGTRDTSALQWEHQHFFDSEGNNFGFFGDSQVRPDSKDMLPQYTFGDIKYDAEIIDEAADQYEQDKNKMYQIMKEVSSYPLYDWSDFDPAQYDLLNNNCQDYINEVLKRARHIAKEKNQPLILP